MAVILTGDVDLYGEKMVLADLAYDAIVETGVHAQTWPVSTDEWQDPEKHSNPFLVRAMQRDGLSAEEALGSGPVRGQLLDQPLQGDSSSFRETFDGISGIDSNRWVKTNRNFLSPTDRAILVEIAKDGLEEHRISRRANAILFLDKSLPSGLTRGARPSPRLPRRCSLTTRKAEPACCRPAKDLEELERESK